MALNEKRILLVDDEKRLLDSISKRISLLGLTPVKASSGVQAIEIAKTTDIDLAIVDLKMPDMDGLVTITKLKEIIPDLRTVLLTGYGNEKVKQATEALGSQYIEKDSMGGLWEVIKKSANDGKVVVIKPPSEKRSEKTGHELLNHIEVMDPGHAHDSESKNTVPAMGGTLPKIIGETHQIQRIKKNINRFSEMDCHLIIKGEVGTGKELFARKIHQLSHRKDQRFIAFDCGCFSNDFRFNELIRSFGDRALNKDGRGTFNPETLPYFSGTIFLDHIENMPQVVLHEILERLDENQNSFAGWLDARFIVVDYQNSEGKGLKREFQEELFKRLHAVEIQIPALRQRKDDLPILCRYFMSLVSREFGKNVHRVHADVRQILESYSFPGNISELKHVIERAVILCDDDTIGIEHLPERMRSAIPIKTFEKESAFPTIQQMEQQHILNAIQITGGNKTKAAELLGISRAALWRKLRIIASDS